MKQNQKNRIRNRDNKYVSKIGRFRLIRDVFLFISILIFIALIAGFFSYKGPHDILEFGGLFFCLLVAYAAHIRVQHIESIHYYKGLESQISGQNPLNSKAADNT